MKITEVNLIENTTQPLGLNPVSMKNIGNIVLLAGKNGFRKICFLRFKSLSRINTFSLL